METCHEHTGCVTDITNLKEEVVELRKCYRGIDDRVDSIMTKLNVVLGGIVVAAVLLVVNIIIESKLHP